MNTQEIKTIIKQGSHQLGKHSPVILSSMAIVGTIITAVEAVRATPKALRLLEEDRDYREKVDMEPISKLETVKLVGPCYIYPAFLGISTIGFIIGAQLINGKRQAALASAYAMTELALNEYKDQIVEKIGDKGLEEITNNIYKDRLKNNPVEESNVYITGNGQTLCLDMVTGRYFKSDMESIRRAENELNKQMLNDVWISLNEVYYELGLPEVSIGDYLGWDIERDGFIEFHMGSDIASDGTPCLVVNHYPKPKYN